MIWGWLLRNDRGPGSRRKLWNRDPQILQAPGTHRVLDLSIVLPHGVLGLIVHLTLETLVPIQSNPQKP